MPTSSPFSDRIVLITGGTGTFGQAFAKYLLEKENVRKVIIFSRDEWKQWHMRESDPLFCHPNIRYFLGDVRDKDRLVRAFHEVDFVVHAAALKQVPAAEYNPSEFIKTNVLGAMNVIDAAIEAQVKKVIALSTDKAVNPVNLYGASKLCSDKLFRAAMSYVGNRGYPAFSVVRYGNVLNSRGSIIPYWESLLQKGEKTLPITDLNMTRFWITTEQAASFVKEAFLCMKGGEIFVPKIPSMRIIDLLKAFAPQASYTICGIRPGEKIDEVLISEDDSRYTYEHATYYTIAAICTTIDKETYTLEEKAMHGKKVPPGFILSSIENPLFIKDIEKIKKFLNRS